MPYIKKYVFHLLLHLLYMKKLNKILYKIKVLQINIVMLCQ